MVSETSLPPVFGDPPASSTPDVTVELTHRREMGGALRRLAHFFARSLEAPYLPAEPVIEAQARVGLDMWTL